MTKERVVLALPPGVSAEAIRDRAIRRGFRRFLVRGSVASRPGADDHREVDGAIRSPDRPPIPIVTVGDPDSLAPVAERIRRGEAVAVRWRGDRVLPLETLVAARVRPGSLWVVVDRAEQLPSTLGALEHGADTAVVEVASPEEVDRLERALEALPRALSLVRATIRDVRPGGMGDRVLVDTTSLLKHDEGMFVGSHAGFLLLVLSEAIGSEYTRPRPFRVNAGAAHSYTLTDREETRYLSELAPGEAVLIGSVDGTARLARVGRLKIERRPLTLVEVAVANTLHTVFVQEAETVRFATPDGAAPVPSLSPGVELLGLALPAARHLGTAISESIDER